MSTEIMDLPGASTHEDDTFTHTSAAMGARDSVLRTPGADSEGDLHDQRIESLNMSLRKVTKARGSFPNDEAVFKLLYLTLRNIAKKWTMSVHDWKATLNRFAIVYENRLPVE
jgi:Transposase, Mutator family